MLRLLQNQAYAMITTDSNVVATGEHAWKWPLSQCRKQSILNWDKSAAK